MARKARVEFDGAIYQVLDRGDRREAIFVGHADRERFRACLAETCGRTGLRVHRCVLMGNHDHLLLETPEPNLVAGMKWLQGTYTRRCNRRHRLRGHLFQGGYKALPVECGGRDDYFAAVSEYIHLNPVPARMVEATEGALEGYRWGSYPQFAGARGLPGWLSRTEVFAQLGLPDGRAGSRRRYGTWMTRRAREATDRTTSLEHAADRPGRADARGGGRA